ISVNVMLIGPTVLLAPVTASVIVPVTLPDEGSDESYFTATLSAPEPEPDAGVTVSQGLLDVAVQAVPAPVCRKRIVCAGVVAPSAEPVLTAPNASDDRSIDAAPVGASAPVMSTVMENGGS